jgi:uncharacterized membrane protein YphA (DoxX/SURF4 family)
VGAEACSTEYEPRSTQYEKEEEMSGTTLRIIIALVFFVHGVGHFMGIMPALGLSSVKGWSSRSWLLTPLLGETASRHS